MLGPGSTARDRADEASAAVKLIFYSGKTRAAQVDECTRWFQVAKRLLAE